MRTALGILVLLLAAADATAQRPFDSFDALLAVIEPGQKVIIQEDNGDSTRGEVVEVALDRIDLTWRNWRFQRKARSFSKPAVRTIRIVDSTWNGELIALLPRVGWMPTESC